MSRIALATTHKETVLATAGANGWSVVHDYVYSLDLKRGETVVFVQFTLTKRLSSANTTHCADGDAYTRISPRTRGKLQALVDYLYDPADPSAPARCDYQPVDGDPAIRVCATHDPELGLYGDERCAQDKP
jgi:hypothetical protein